MPYLKKIFPYVAVVLFCVLALEAGLRVFPSLIPLQFLVWFNSSLRGDVAERLGYPVARSMRAVQRDDRGPPLSIPNPGFVHRFPPLDIGEVDQITLDDLGFCNPPQKVKNRSNLSFDVVALGDSFSYCTYVEPQNIWPTVLDDVSDYSTYVLSRTGISVFEYIQLLKAFGLALKPKVVILAYYAGNDLRGVYDYMVYANNQRKGTDGDADPKSGLKGVYNYVSNSIAGRNSYALNVGLSGIRYARALAIQRLATSDIAESQARPINPQIDFFYDLVFEDRTIPFNPQNSDTDEVFIARLLRDGQIKLASIDPAIRELEKLSKKYGFQPIIVFVPSAHITYKSHVSFSDPTLRDLLNWFNDEQRDYLSHLASGLSIPFLDLTDGLRNASENVYPELLYFPVNLHFSSAGHREVARIVKSWMSAQSVLRLRDQPNESVTFQRESLAR